MRVTRRSMSAGLVSALAVSGCAGVARKASSETPEAATRSGRVRGHTRKGAAVFMGIPYGADTSGANRFRAPMPPQPWGGVRDATMPGQRAPQPTPPRLAGSDLAAYFTGGRAAELDAVAEPLGEDCLVLNVVTPDVDRAGRPVLFYIHGGGFTSGSGRVLALADEFVLREDVVLVTVNHRLGAAGFLYLGGIDPRYATGNPGMLDLVAALEWVRENIENFGGDPGKVTIFGESGGGAKVSLLMAMPHAAGLFRAAIIQSGVLTDLQSPEAATLVTRAIMQEAGARTVEDLQRLPINTLSSVEWPTADGATLQHDMWTSPPAIAAKVPLIIGYCRDENTIFSMARPALFNLAWPDVRTELAPLCGISGTELEPLIDLYRTAFPADGPTDCFFRMSSEIRFGKAAVSIAAHKVKQSPPVFFYRMEYDTHIAPGLRAFHTAELPLTVSLVWQPEAATLSRQISSAWAAFARNLDPNHDAMPRWRRYDPGLSECMIFDLHARCAPDPQAVPRKKLLTAIERARL
jgi:para-nitrobenzyl esterase